MHLWKNNNLKKRSISKEYNKCIYEKIIILKTKRTSRITKEHQKNINSYLYFMDIIFNYDFRIIWIKRNSFSKERR